jgi:hypothetical protein
MSVELAEVYFSPVLCFLRAGAYVSPALCFLRQRRLVGAYVSLSRHGTCSSGLIFEYSRQRRVLQSRLCFVSKQKDQESESNSARRCGRCAFLCTLGPKPEPDAVAGVVQPFCARWIQIQPDAVAGVVQLSCARWIQSQTARQPDAVASVVQLSCARWPSPKHAGASFVDSKPAPQLARLTRRKG